MTHNPFAAVANALWLQRDLHRFLDHLGSKGLPLQHVPVSEGGFWLVHHPELVRDVLQADETRVGKPDFLQESNRGWHGDGLTTLEGPAWKARRATVMQVLSSTSIERRMRREAVAATRLMLRGLPADTPFDLSAELLRLVIRIALAWIISAEPSVSGDGARSHVPWEEAMGAWHRVEPCGSDAGLMPCARLRPAASVPTLKRIIERKWREPDPGADDFISVFHRVCRDHGEMPSEEDALNEILQLLFAGHHTMSTTLLHCLDRLQRHPEARERLKAGGCTENFVKEVMRFCMPTTLLFRETRQRFPLGSESLAARELLVISPYLMQRDPRWFPHPLRFDPGRFEGPIDGHAYLSLGAGRRRCAAHGIVLSQLTVMLETWVANGAVALLDELPAQGFAFTLPGRSHFARYLGASQE